MKIPDDVLKEYRKQKLTMDIPKPIVTGHTEVSKEKREKRKSSRKLKKWIEENNMKAKEAGVPVISAMGAGNKLNPALFEVADIYKTSVWPPARVMRRELKKRGVKKLKVVYSKEEPREGLVLSEDALEENQMVGRSGKPKKAVPGSISFVPPVMGLIIAGEVVREFYNFHKNVRKT